MWCPRPAATLLMYDGLCGLCDRLVRFIVSRDAAGCIRYAPLQSTIARDLLLANGRNPEDLDTVYVVANWKTPNQQLLVRSRAVVYALAQLGGGWRWFARAASLVPGPVADLAYSGVARIRYSVFGRYDACPIPPAKWRERFVERQEPG